MKRNLIYCTLIPLILLILMGISACSAEINSADDAQSVSETLTIVSTFFQENGRPLGENTVQISNKNNQNTYLLSEDGALRVANVPRESDLTFTLLDENERRLGSLSLQFVTGAITDASTGSENRGRVTVKNDVEEVNLIFTLMENGGMQCALDLTEYLET